MRLTDSEKLLAVSSEVVLNRAFFRIEILIRRFQEQTSPSVNFSSISRLLYLGKRNDRNIHSEERYDIARTLCQTSRMLLELAKPSDEPETETPFPSLLKSRRRFPNRKRASSSMCRLADARSVPSSWATGQWALEVIMSGGWIDEDAYCT